jgi:hypothetical protein
VKFAGAGVVAGLVVLTLIIGVVFTVSPDKLKLRLGLGGGTLPDSSGVDADTNSNPLPAVSFGEFYKSGTTALRVLAWSLRTLADYFLPTSPPPTTDSFDDSDGAVGLPRKLLRAWA